MLDVLLPRIYHTGLKDLGLSSMRGGVTGGDVIPKFVNSSITTLTQLDLSKNSHWWKSDDSIAQLLTILERQTQLEGFQFDEMYSQLVRQHSCSSASPIRTSSSSN